MIEIHKLNIQHREEINVFDTTATTTHPISSHTPDNELTPDRLLDLIDPKNLDLLTSIGGVEGLASKLDSSLLYGISTNQLELQISKYGNNSLPEPVSHSFFQFVWEALKDQTLIVLMIAAAVEMSVGLYEALGAPVKSSIELMDGGAILVASTVESNAQYPSSS